MDAVDKKYIKEYFLAVKKLYDIGNVESSYNVPIISLLNQFGCSAKDMSGERGGQAGENIDIKLWHDDNEVGDIEPFAGIEVKKVGGIDARAKTQIQVEAKKYGNAILTDNLLWEFWSYSDNNDELVKYSAIQLIEYDKGNLVINEKNAELFVGILYDFLTKTPALIKSSDKLAEYMAKHARTIRSVVLGILKEDDNKLPIVNEQQRAIPMFSELYGLFSRIKSELRPVMNTRDFADMYAQTIVYGLFIARYNDKSLDSFSRYEAIEYLQEESELLKQFFIHITSAGKRHAALDLVIDKLCNLYRICDIRELLDRDEHKDTITHFYEEFLKFYDPKLRKDLGVFYTPSQAVRFLVSQVDRILVEEFSIDRGLANNDLIDVTLPSERYQAGNNKWTETKKVQVPRVAVLDPACGTGSFGSEIIKYVKDQYFSGSKEIFYSDYIHNNNSLLSRLIGFEIMMTSYVVAHLKMKRTIDQTLGGTSGSEVSPSIYLTNTLAPASALLERNQQISLFDFSAAITNEAYHADTWKIRRPIKVIIGNPPYLSASTNPYDISAYKTETDGKTDFGEKKHWLNDDYVKFFRFAEQIINRNNDGVLAYVSNNGYLDNPTFRGMRASLLRSFDKIYIVNLHGSANKKETTPDGQKDENIFDIMQGISLFIGVKKSKSEKWAKVYYSDVWGDKKTKLDILEKCDLSFEELSIDEKMAYFVPFGDSDKNIYEKGISVKQLFPISVTGIVSGNDSIAFAPTRSELEQRIERARNGDSETIKQMWGKFTKGQTAEKIQADVFSEGKVTPISFRPFDSWWTYYTGNSCGWVFRPREKSTMGHLMAEPSSPIGANVGLVYCKTSRNFFKPFVSTNIIAHRLFSAMCEIAYIAPLYLHNDTPIGGSYWTENIDKDSYDQLVQYMTFEPTAEEVFDYTYAILHDPVYCERFEQYLIRDFPRIPIVNAPSDLRCDDDFYVDEDMFRAYSDIGKRLRKLHLLQTKKEVNISFEPNTSDNLEIGSIKYSKGVLSLNSNKKITGIEEKVWKYEIGGYQVLEKWFKTHKGETLDLDKVMHLESVIGSIAETIKLEEELANMHRDA